MSADHPLKVAPLHLLDYEQVRYVARTFLGKLADWRNNPATLKSIKRIDEYLRAVALFTDARALKEMEKIMNSRNALLNACTKIFLSGRLGPSLFDYLTIQESTDDGTIKLHPDPLSLLISKYILRSGNNGIAGIRLSVTADHKKFGISMKINLDPFSNLRRIYNLVIRARRAKRALYFSERFYISINKISARAKTVTIRGAAWGYSKHYAFRRRTIRSEHFGALRGTNLAHGIKNLASIAFNTKELTEGEVYIDVQRLVTTLVPYLSDRIDRVICVLPAEALNDHGLAKLGKMALGALLGRARALTIRNGDITSYVIDSFRMAYCWGATYPLIDDVLDAARTDTDTRNSLFRAVDQLFAPNPQSSRCPPPLSPSPIIRELVSCLTELLDLISTSHLEDTKTVLRHLFEAHRRDAMMKLSRLDSNKTTDDVIEVALLKGALVRIATAYVVGSFPDERRLHDLIATGLLNQLTDDIWDAAQDFQEDRVTPVTSFLVDRSVLNPYDLYYDLTAFVLENKRDALARAAAFRVAETSRQGLEGWADCSRPFREIRKLLNAHLSHLETNIVMTSAQHIDPDELAFGFEAAFRPQLRALLGG